MSYVSNVADVSGLSIPDCPFSFYKVYFQVKEFKYFFKLFINITKWKTKSTTLSEEFQYRIEW
jgi:hypothetical protein